MKYAIVIEKAENNYSAYVLPREHGELRERLISACSQFDAQNVLIWAPNMKFLIIASAIFVSFQAIATQQIKEEFDVDMATFEIEQQPLDSFIEREKFLEKVTAPLCSANWRGYKGYWALRGGKLMLTRLVTDACSKEPIPLDAKKLFSGKDYPVEAEWYTGKIIVRIGERKFFTASDSGPSGVECQAVVYEFQAGKLLSRSIETVKEP